jgi:hypothetical protein
VNNSSVPTTKSYIEAAKYPFIITVAVNLVGLERGPLSLVRIIEEIFQGKSGSGLEN